MLTSCFSTLGCVDYALDDILALAERFSIPALELRGMGGKIDPRGLDLLAPNRIADTAAHIRAAVRPAVYGSSIACTDAFRDDAKFASGLGEIDTAAALGFPYLRVFGNKYIDGDEVASVEAAADVLRRLDDYAAPRGVEILLEVHGEFVHAETFTTLFARLADRPRIGLIWDIAHTDRPYREDWPRFWEAVAPRVRHIHVKDHIRVPHAQVMLDEGDIPIRDILRRLDADGFGGCVSLEWERKWHPELAPIEDALAQFCTMLQSI